MSLPHHFPIYLKNPDGKFIRPSVLYIARVPLKGEFVTFRDKHDSKATEYLVVCVHTFCNMSTELDSPHRYYIEVTLKPTGA